MRAFRAMLLAGCSLLVGCHCVGDWPLPGEYLPRETRGALDDVTSINFAGDLMVLNLEFDDGTVGTVIYRVRKKGGGGGDTDLDTGERWWQ